MHKRIKRESKTLKQMIELYCRENHSSNGLYAQRLTLLEYARQCLEKCPFQEGKTTWTQCPVHCYSPEMKERIRTIMRYSEPWMLYKHPSAFIWHLIDGQRKEPVQQNARTGDNNSRQYEDCRTIRWL